MKINEIILFYEQEDFVTSNLLSQYKISSNEIDKVAIISKGWTPGYLMVRRFSKFSYLDRKKAINIAIKKEASMAAAITLQSVIRRRQAIEEKKLLATKKEEREQKIKDRRNVTARNRREVASKDRAKRTRELEIKEKSLK